LKLNPESKPKQVQFSLSGTVTVTSPELAAATFSAALPLRYPSRARSRER
jgi:hypothetical protein